MTFVVAMAGQKGGTGKSTIAISLAAEWHFRGRRVLLVDADPQGSALTWGEVASENSAEGPTVVAMGENIHRDLPRLADGYEAVVIDCPGRAAGKRTSAALLIADLALLPCGPAALDIWALAESIEAVQNAQALRPDLRAAIVLNRADRSGITKSARDMLTELRLPALKTTLGARVAFAESVAAGKGVTRFASGSVAANEMRRLLDEIEDLAEFTEDRDVA